VFAVTSSWLARMFSLQQLQATVQFMPVVQLELQLMFQTSSVSVTALAPNFVSLLLQFALHLNESN